MDPVHEQQERMQTIFKDTLVQFCKNDVVCKSDVRMQGTVSVTLDGRGLFVLHMDEHISADTEGHDVRQSTNTEQADVRPSASHLDMGYRSGSQQEIGKLLKTTTSAYDGDVSDGSDLQCSKQRHNKVKAATPRKRANRRRRRSFYEKLDDWNRKTKGTISLCCEGCGLPTVDIHVMWHHQLNVHGKPRSRRRWLQHYS